MAAVIGAELISFSSFIVTFPWFIAWLISDREIINKWESDGELNIILKENVIKKRLFVIRVIRLLQNDARVYSFLLHNLFKYCSIIYVGRKHSYGKEEPQSSETPTSRTAVVSCIKFQNNTGEIWSENEQEQGIPYRSVYVIIKSIWNNIFISLMLTRD